VDTSAALQAQGNGTDQSEHGASAGLWPPRQHPALRFASGRGCGSRQKAPHPQPWQSPTQRRGGQDQAVARTGRRAGGKEGASSAGPDPAARSRGRGPRAAESSATPAEHPPSCSLGAEFALNLCTRACFAHRRIYIYTYILITYTYIYIHTRTSHPSLSPQAPAWPSSWRGARRDAPDSNKPLGAENSMAF